MDYKVPEAPGVGILGLILKACLLLILAGGCYGLVELVRDIFHKI